MLDTVRSTVSEREAREVIRGSIPGEVERATPPSNYITLHYTYFNSLLSYSQKHEIIKARVKEFM